LLGVLHALYVVRTKVAGAVYAKSGIWGRTFRRDDDRFGFWSAIVAYSLLSLAMLFVF
jgi:hypothetical protein